MLSYVHLDSEHSSTAEESVSTLYIQRMGVTVCLVIPKTYNKVLDLHLEIDGEET